MVTVRKATARGHFDHGWLNTFHSFSFGDYHDPKQMGYRSLRVINEDFVTGGQGFGMHGHRDMEIITYVLSGAIEHRDSIGTQGLIRPGDVQRMSAGTGIRHSEFNPSETEPTHLLQIWIMPDTAGLSPSYEEKTFSETDKRNRLCVIASPDGREGSVHIHQDAVVYAVHLEPKGMDAEVPLPVAAGRGVWVQVLTGELSIGYGGSTAKTGEMTPEQWMPLAAGDGAAIEEEDHLVLRAAHHPASALVFDLR